MRSNHLNRGQISLVVIIGLIIVLGVATLVFYSKNNINKYELEDTLDLQANQELLNTIMKSCLEETANQAVHDFGLYPSVSDTLIEEQIIKNLPVCVGATDMFENLGFIDTEVQVTVEITNEAIIIDLDYPIKLVKGNSQFIFKKQNYYIPRTYWTEIISNRDTVISSPNQYFRITVPAGTSVIDGDQNFGMKIIDREFEGLSNRIVIGMLAFSGLPEHADFSQPIELAIFYEDYDIPNTVNENDLRIGYFDEKSRTWFALPTTIDTVENKLVANTDHFTPYAIVIRCTEDLEAIETYVPISVNECCEQDVEITFADQGNSCIWKGEDQERNAIIEVIDSENPADEIDADIVIESVCPENEVCLVKDTHFTDNVLTYVFDATNAKPEIVENQGTNIRLIGYGMQLSESYYACQEGEEPKEMPIFGGDPLDIVMSECVCETVEDTEICKWTPQENAETIEGTSINMIRRVEVNTYNLDSADQCEDFEESVGGVFKTDKELDTRSRSFEDKYGDYPEMQYKDWMSFSAETELIIFGSAMVDDVCWILVEAQDDITVEGTTWNVDFWVKLDELGEVELISKVDIESDSSDENEQDETDSETSGELHNSCTYCDKNVELYNQMFPDNPCSSTCCVGACPDNTVLLDVPYHNQCDYNIEYDGVSMCDQGCGPAVTVMALDYFDFSEDLMNMEELFLNYKNNQYRIYTMYQYACGHDACAQPAMTVNNNDLDWLKDQIDQDHPVIITTYIDGFTNEACHDFEREGHFILLVGYSSGYMIVHDPNPKDTCEKREYGKNLVLSNEAFLNAMSSSSAYVGPLKNPNDVI